MGLNEVQVQKEKEAERKPTMNFEEGPWPLRSPVKHGEAAKKKRGKTKNVVIQSQHYIHTHFRLISNPADGFTIKIYFLSSWTLKIVIRSQRYITYTRVRFISDWYNDFSIKIFFSTIRSCKWLRFKNVYIVSKHSAKTTMLNLY